MELHEVQRRQAAAESEREAARRAQAEAEERLACMSGDLNRCQRIYLYLMKR